MIAVAFGEDPAIFEDEIECFGLGRHIEKMGLTSSCMLVKVGLIELATLGMGLQVPVLTSFPTGH